MTILIVRSLLLSARQQHQCNSNLMQMCMQW